jgi:hypothetical protein
MRDNREIDADWISSVAPEPVESHTLIELPDLPIRASLP